jgi:hypothetical protein
MLRRSLSGSGYEKPQLGVNKKPDVPFVRFFIATLCAMPLKYLDIDIIKIIV